MGKDVNSSSNNTKRIAVLMTIHNRKDSTLKCLYHFFQNVDIMQETLTADVYLVDDGSSDGSSEAIEESYPQVKIIHGNGQLFWNRGMLLAWENASKYEYDFFLWLNDDTFLYDNALRTMYETYKKNNYSVIVGCTCSESSPRIVTYGGFDERGRLVPPNGESQILYSINGNFVLIPKRVFEVCGLLPYQLHHSGGDNYYSIITRKKGIPCLLTPAFIGTCERHERPQVCYDAEQPLIKRLCHLHSPLGNPPNEVFFLSRLNKGCLYGIISVAKLYLHVLFPRVWNKIAGK